MKLTCRAAACWHRRWPAGTGLWPRGWSRSERRCCRWSCPRSPPAAWLWSASLEGQRRCDGDTPGAAVHYSGKSWLEFVMRTLGPQSDGNAAPVPVAMSKRKEKMLPRSSPAHRILPGASKERDSTRPVSLLEPPFTFFPVEMFTTCRWCLLFPTWNTTPSENTFIRTAGSADTNTQKWSTRDLLRLET